MIKRISLALISIILVFSLSCVGLPRDNYEFIIENQTSEELEVYIDGVIVFNTPLQPGEARKIPAGVRYDWRITAKNNQGQLVFSLVLKPDDIPDTPSPYKILIAPMNKAESSDNTTGKQ